MDPDLHPVRTESDAAGSSSTAALERLTKIAEREIRTSRYTITEEIGRGGMGQILRVRDEDLRRDLAMKVVRAEDGAQSGDSSSSSLSLARFLEEAQVTGQLEHPGVVPVHDLGIDESGQPYFTMRLVRGRDLGEVFLLVRDGREGWNLTRALGVVLKVCEAMTFAHDKRVVHRDLKPSNIMVGPYGEVYVMDWGLARVEGRDELRDLRASRTRRVETDRREAESSDPWSPLFTADGAVLGTPGYMSPEQAAGRTDLVGPLSDVYAVGAILYQLLAGRVPHLRAGERVRMDELLERIQADPAPPLHQTAPQVPAELAAICEKAIAPEPEERYASMSDLASDLRAYLEQRVVRAYRTGAVAELRKWVARNRGLAAALAATVLVALGGLGGMLWVGAQGRAEVETKNRELSASNAAVEGANLGLQASQAELEDANRELSASNAELGAVVAFLTDMFDRGDPDQARGRDVTVAEVLDDAREALRTQLIGQPVVRAKLLSTLGKVNSSLGLFSEAEELLVEARDALLGLEEPDAVQVLKLRGMLAQVWRYQSRLDEAEAEFAAVAEGLERELGPEAPFTLTARANLAECYRNQGRLELAEERFRVLVAIDERLWGATDERALLSRGNLAGILRETGQFEEAEELLVAVCADLERVQGPNHTHTLTAKSELAYLYLLQGRLEESRALTEDVLERRRALYEPDHPRVLRSRTNLGTVLGRQNRFDEAIEELTGVDVLLEAQLGPAHPDTLAARRHLGNVYYMAYRSAEAVNQFQAALDTLLTVRDEDSHDVISVRFELARALVDVGEVPGAIELLEPALDSARRALSEGEELTLRIVLTLLEAYAEEADSEKLEALLMDCRERIAQAFEAGHRPVMLVLGTSRFYLDHGRPTEAQPLLEALAEKLPAGHPGRGALDEQLGELRAALEQE